MKKGSLVLVASALLGSLWAAGCGSDSEKTLGGDAETPRVTECNSFTYAGCSYDDVGCDANTESFEDRFEDRANNCSVTVRVECNARGCIDTVATIPGLSNGDGGNTTPPVTAGESPFGAPCEADADCPDGLTCLAADGTDWLGGGPSNGYCTASCASDPTVCAQFPNSVCVVGASDSEAYCFETCVRGPGTGLFDVKCHGRADTACLQVGATVSACMPTCGADNQCPDGLFCDIANGICVEDQPQGDPVGTACDPNATENTCAGFCMDFGDGFAICSGVCTVGLDAPSCGLNPATDEIVPGSPICLPLLGETDAVGDTGLCLQRCDCNDNCLTGAASCEPFTTADVMEALSAQGLCLPSSPDSEGLVCGDGGTVEPITDAGIDEPDAATPSSSLDAGDGG